MNSNGLSLYASSPSMSNYGGKRKGKKTMKGGYKGWSPLNNIASTASPFSGATSQPQVFVGGKRRKSTKKSVKSGRKRTKKIYKNKK